MIFASNKNGQAGAVALITAIIISILLTIIVTGLVGLMASELRQSNDAEQSTRAYYAAQSGIEDGVQKVIRALQGIDPYPTAACASQTQIVAGIPVGWTCQSITFSGSPEGVLPVPDQSVTIDLAGAPNFDTMTVSWDRTTNPTALMYAMPVPLPSSSWTGAAALELSFIDYLKLGSYADGAAAQLDIKTRNLLMVPETIGPFVSPNVALLAGNNPYSGKCTVVVATNGYHCSLSVTGFNTAARGYIIRLRSRFAGTAYKLDFSSAGLPVQVPDGTATIDVTAKAGDVFRRVIYKVPINNGAASGLDYVLFSDNDVCKNYQIVSGTVVTGSVPCN